MFFEAGTAAAGNFGGIAAVVMVLGGVIFFHELGHFLVAKAFGIGIKTFSLGFGPKLFAFTRGNTCYQIAAFPFGGYVAMVGESDPHEIPEPFTLQDSFAVRPAWQRLLVVAAGPFFNLLLTVFLYSLLFLSQGQRYLLPEVGGVRADYPAYAAGMAEGDVIHEIDGAPVSRWDEVVEKVSASNGVPLQFTVLRGNSQHTIFVTPKPFVRETLLGDKVTSWAVGINAAEKYGNRRFTPGGAVVEAFRYTRNITALIGRNIVKLFERTAPIDSVGGPIRLVGEIFKSANEYGVAGGILAAAFISLNLGLLNLLPIPLLDGGHIALLSVEIIRRKPLSEKVMEVLARIGITLLLSLMLLATYNDIFQWIFRK